MKYTFDMLDGELWWGGTTVDGRISPFDRSTVFERDFIKLCPNETMPMYLSNMGRCIWSEDPFKVKIENGRFELEGGEITLESFGETLRDAYMGASMKHFPPRGEYLPEEFFRSPQYNTWMQLTYDQNQKDVLDYAEKIIENGFQPGIFIIDEGWQKFYGNWDFDREKFPDPVGMVKRLHEMGYTVMLWVVPNVRADGVEFLKMTASEFDSEFRKEILLRNDDGKVSILLWWDGYSAILDMTKKCDRDYLDRQLTALIENYGIDGFKFDGGNIDNYADYMCINGNPETTHTPHERNQAWNAFGTRYRFHEYKDTFKGGGQRVIQRIWDKHHAWGENGLAELIPCAILQGITGHPFLCPDMVGGGQYTIRTLHQEIDPELFVRMAQCSALFPMMQFSWAPWEAVDGEYLDAIRKSAQLHSDFGDTFVALVNDAYKTGEPILRSLEYNYPHSGYAKVHDIFMLGEDILVAPVLEKGQTKREVPLPVGNWKYVDGTVYEGGRTVTLDVDLFSIPYFMKV